MKGGKAGREKHYSPIRFILEARKRSNEEQQGRFVAFGRERDGMGRLMPTETVN